MGEQQRSVKSRKYELKQRAESQAATRRRITEAAVELHGSVGPRYTTISSVAELAGVTRLTVYRHFPGDDDLFAACTTHWRAEHPRPDPQVWAEVLDPEVRLTVALTDLYGWFGEDPQMLGNVMRDLDVMPMFAANVWEAFGRAMKDVLVPGWATDRRSKRRVAAAVGHATSFATWRSLVMEQGLRGDDAVELMVALVRTAAHA
jgi:AcrR family transcriptional regulator